MLLVVIRSSIVVIHTETQTYIIVCLNKEIQSINLYPYSPVKVDNNIIMHLRS